METVFEKRREDEVLKDVDPIDLSCEKISKAPTSQTVKAAPPLRLVISSPAEPAPPKRGFWDQIKGGLRAAWKILYPAALILWLGGALLDRAMRGFIPAETPSASNPLPGWLTAKANENSTPLINLESKHGAWKGMVSFRLLLHEYSSPMAGWIDGLYREGKLEFAPPGARFSDTRYSDYRKLSGKLTLYPDFFLLTDAKKIVALEHEFVHSKETLPGYISSSVTPQVIVGAAARSIGDTFGLGKVSEFGASWSYNGNSSEVAAIEAENRAAIRLGQTDLILDDYHFDKVIPGQTLLGIFAGITSIVSVLRRRKEKPN